MSKRVYGLKHATPKMKYQHMGMMMEFKADLKERQANPEARHAALEEIKERLGAEAFNSWYNGVYALRREGKQREYEEVIFKKLDELKSSSAVGASSTGGIPPSAQREGFQWKVASANTLRGYAAAVKDFETVTNRRVEQADVVSMARWVASMKGRKLAGNTIRSRVSAIRILSGVKYPLPHKPKIQTPTLTLEQTRAILRAARDSERVVLMRELSGVSSTLRSAQRETAAHFLGAEDIHLDTQALNRIVKRGARKAGLDERRVSLRVWRASGAALLKRLTPAEFAEAFQPMQAENEIIPWKKQLHGIGRRSHPVKA